MEFKDLGTISFSEAYELQAQQLEEIHCGNSPETVFLLEHPPVFTTGRRGLDENLIATRNHRGEVLEVVRINRGGDVTYHGPGQLVVYPLLDLRKRGRDLNRYLRSLEESVIQTSEHFGIHSYRRDSLTGVWTDHGKLASIGVGVRRWITMHGLALNVSTDLRCFELINPCGIPGCPVTSLERLLGERVDMAEVKRVIQNSIIRTLAPVVAPVKVKE